MAVEDQNPRTGQTVVGFPGRSELPGGGGPTGGNDLEIRLSRLEKQFEKIETKIDGLSSEVVDLRVQSATLSERVTHLPSKEYIFKGIVGIITVMVALTVFGPRVQAFFGVEAAPSAQIGKTTP